MRLEQPRRELRTSPADVVEAVRPARRRRLGLVAPEAHEELAEAQRGCVQQGVGLLLPGAAGRDGDRKGLAQLEEPGAGEGQEDRSGRGRVHGATAESFVVDAWRFVAA